MQRKTWGGRRPGAGRPAVGDERTVILTASVLPQQRAWLAEHAGARGVNLSAALRQVLEEASTGTGARGAAAPKSGEVREPARPELRRLIDAIIAEHDGEHCRRRDRRDWAVPCARCDAAERLGLQEPPPRSATSRG